MSEEKKDYTTIPQQSVDRIAEKLREKAPNPTCPICAKKGGWKVENRIFTPWPLEHKDGKSSLPLSFPIYPLAMLVCGNCGNTQYVNTKVLGGWEVEDLASGGEDV